MKGYVYMAAKRFSANSQKLDVNIVTEGRIIHNVTRDILFGKIAIYGSKDATSCGCRDGTNFVDDVASIGYARILALSTSPR